MLLAPPPVACPPTWAKETFQADSVTCPTLLPDGSKLGVNPVPPTSVTLGSAPSSLIPRVVAGTQLAVRPAAPQSPEDTKIACPWAAACAYIGLSTPVKKDDDPPHKLKLTLMTPH